MFLKKYKSSVEKLIEVPAEKPVHKTKEKKESPKKSKVKNDSNIFFEMNKTKDIIVEEKKVSGVSPDSGKATNKQPEHLRLALEARRARLADEKKQVIKPIKKEKKKGKNYESDSDSTASLDINKLKLKETPKKYFSDTDSE
jgi:hypothetical protein